MQPIYPFVRRISTQNRRRKPYPRQTWSVLDHPLRRHGHSKFDISRGLHLGPPFWGKGRS